MQKQDPECNAFQHPEALESLFESSGELKIELASLIWMHLFYRADMDHTQTVDFCATFREHEALVAQYLSTMDADLISSDYKEYLAKQMLQVDSEQDVSYPAVLASLQAEYSATSKDEESALKGIASLLTNGATQEDLETTGLPADLLPYVKQLQFQ